MPAHKAALGVLLLLSLCRWPAWLWLPGLSSGGRPGLLLHKRATPHGRIVLHDRNVAKQIEGFWKETAGFRRTTRRWFQPAQLCEYEYNAFYFVTLKPGRA